MMQRFGIALGLAFLVSCTQQQPALTARTADTPTTSSGDAAIHSGNQRTLAGFCRKQLGGLNYSMRILPMLDFLQRKGETVAAEDRDDLSKETVVLLEMALENTQKDIWKNPGMQLSEEDAVNYLVGELASDLTIEQNGITRHATGTSFEGRTGAAHQLRVQLYFGNIDCKQPMKALYYDRLFGAGLIKFGINER